MAKERRRYPRAIASWPVVLVTSEGDLTGRTRDISAGGAFICCRQPLRSNEKFSIVLYSIPQLGRHLRIIAKVVRSDIYCNDLLMSHGMGVQFTSISEEDHKLLSTLVSDYQEPTEI
jgi:c-di-GMP-binding flagellar brake protein YcgR